MVRSFEVMKEDIVCMCGEAFRELVDRTIVGGAVSTCVAK